MGCSPKTKKYVVFGIGIFLLIVGVFIGGFMNMIIDSVLVSQLVLSPTSTSYQMWSDVPIPLEMEFTLFNLTNAEEYERDPTVKPIFSEMGPYVFREYHKRGDIIWNNNDTVTFKNIRTWKFDDNKSKGHLHDQITNINIVPATVAFMVKDSTDIERVVLDALLDVTKETFLTTQSAGDLLFYGYEDRLLDIVSKLNSSMKVPFSKFAYFANRNNSKEYDGVFNMYRGETNLDLLGTVATWNYQEEIPYFDSPCNKVRGTTGELWSPKKTDNGVAIFVPDVCSTVKLTYKGSTDFVGLDGKYYMLSEDSFKALPQYPEEKCFCKDMKNCAPYGLLDTTKCKFNAPIYISRPHFMDSDPNLSRAVVGMEPNLTKHKFDLALEPLTGIPLFVNARLQVNVMIGPFPRMSLYGKLPRNIYIPMMWFNQKASLTTELAEQAKLIHQAPAIGMGIFFGLAGIGALILFIGIMITVRRGWDGQDTQKILAN